LLAILSCTIALAGCATTAPQAGGGLIHQRNEGYSLLFKLMSDESQVGNIFILKHADNSIRDLVNQIGSTCQEAKTRLYGFGKSDRSIDFGTTDLPGVEQRSRDLESSDETKALLFSSGQTFELELLFTQVEAMNYAADLSKALAEQEPDPVRKDFLQKLSQHCTDFHDQLMKHLAAT
jgi:hypothetical protein